jgi:hypothetical protein
MRKLLIAAAASLAAFALPAAPAEAGHRGGGRVVVHVGAGSQWGGHLGGQWRQPRWGGHWRAGPRWRGHWRPAARWRGHWRRPARVWARPCASMWWDGWAWRCRW